MAQEIIEGEEFLVDIEAVVHFMLNRGEKNEEMAYDTLSCIIMRGEKMRTAFEIFGESREYARKLVPRLTFPYQTLTEPKPMPKSEHVRMKG